MASRLELILILFLVMVVIIYLTLVGYIIYNIYLKNSSSGSSSTTQSGSKPIESIDINSPFQTDFFNKSAKYAEEVLFNKVFIKEYGEANYYGNKLMDVIHKLNDDTKRSIVIAIKYMTIEPSTARQNERMFRMIAEQEKVPVWFIILREAAKKVVPDFSVQSTSENSDNNVVPIYKIA